jgi:hypothetical protein
MVPCGQAAERDLEPIHGYHLRRYEEGRGYIVLPHPIVTSDYVLRLVIRVKVHGDSDLQVPVSVLIEQPHGHLPWFRRISGTGRS